MRYLITGGAGFIGCNLVRYVLARGHDVVVLDNFATGSDANLAEVRDRIRVVRADIRDQSAVEDASAGCAAIFHLAALGSVQRSVDDPFTSHDVNVTGTLRVLEAARKTGTRRVVFAASSSAYGNQKESPKHEGMIPDPISPYAAGKLACESYLAAYAAVYGLETLCLRYFNVFGPHQDPNGAYAAVIPAFASSLLHGQRPVVYGDGEQTRDFCFVENACEANWLAANAPPAVCTGQPLNIACHRRTSLNQILRQLEKLLGCQVQAEYRPRRPGDVMDSEADVSRAQAAIGYRPRVYFEEGLARAIDWYKQNLA